MNGSTTGDCASGRSMERRGFSLTYPSCTAQVHNAESSVWMLSTDLGDSLILPRGAVRLAYVLLAQPREELDGQAARDGRERGILRLRYTPLRMTGDIRLKFLESRAIIAHSVDADALSGFGADHAVAGLRQRNDRFSHCVVSSLGSNTDNQ